MSLLSRRGRSWSVVSWVALALAGLVVAAAVSLAASRLASQHIGLSSEPISAGQEVTPAEDNARPRHQASPTDHKPHRKAPSVQRAPVVPVQPATPPAQSVSPQPVQPAPQPANPTPSKRQRGDDSRETGNGGSGDD